MLNFIYKKIIFAIMLFSKKPISITLKNPVNISLNEDLYKKIEPYL